MVLCNGSFSISCRIFLSYLPLLIKAPSFCLRHVLFWTVKMLPTSISLKVNGLFSYPSFPNKSNHPTNPHRFDFIPHILTATGDQDWISPYNTNTISSSQVMRIKRNINQGIISWPSIPHTNIIRIVWQTVRRITI